MIKVLGHWEIGYKAPVMEAHEWALCLRDFGIEEWRMSPVSGIENPEWREVNLIEYKNYEEFFKQEEDLKRVFIEPRTEHSNPDTVWLHDYQHPEDCVYVFGSAHLNPTMIYEREEDDIVSIKTVKDKGVLWSSQCLLLVLYDRMVKSWQ